MSAVVVVVPTRYFALTDPEGNYQIGHVPPGRYKLSVWYELSWENELASQTQEVEITPGDNTLTKITLHSSDAPKEHLNKQGERYYPSESTGR
jgi:hypothetical protein